MSTHKEHVLITSAYKPYVKVHKEKEREIAWLLVK